MKYASSTYASNRSPSLRFEREFCTTWLACAGMSRLLRVPFFCFLLLLSSHPRTFHWQLISRLLCFVLCLLLLPLSLCSFGSRIRFFPWCVLSLGHGFVGFGWWGGMTVFVFAGGCCAATDFIKISNFATCSCI